MNFPPRLLPAFVLACLITAWATQTVAAQTVQATATPQPEIATPATVVPNDAAAPTQAAEAATPSPQTQTPITHPDAADLAPAPAPTTALAATSAKPRTPLPPPQVRTPAGALPWYGVLFRVTPPAAPAAVVTPAPTNATDATANNTHDAKPASDAAATGTETPTEDRASWILGTIHFGSDEEHGIDSTRLQRLVDAASTVVNEVDIDAPIDAAMDAYRWLPPEQSLVQLVGEAGMQRARELLPEVAPVSLVRMKPWLVLALLEARGERVGDDTMDVRVQRMAATDGVALVHLEDMPTQLQALDCVPSQEQSQVLAERLRMPWLMQDESARALAFYHRGDLWAWLADVDRMSGLGDTAKAIELRARRCLIEQRNAQWLPKLLPLLAQGGSLVAVGAVHLPGYDGLLAALLRAGYRVEAQPL